MARQGALPAAASVCPRRCGSSSYARRSIRGRRRQISWDRARRRRGATSRGRSNERICAGGAVRRWLHKVHQLTGTPQLGFSRLNLAGFLSLIQTHTPTYTHTCIRTNYLYKAPAHTHRGSLSLRALSMYEAPRCPSTRSFYALSVAACRAFDGFRAP